MRAAFARSELRRARSCRRQPSSCCSRGRRAAPDLPPGDLREPGSCRSRCGRCAPRCRDSSRRRSSSAVWRWGRCFERTERRPAFCSSRRTHAFPIRPRLPSISGTVYQATNECRPAETLFGRVLELRPAHEEARLGRAVCRTYLSRNEEAIADATVLIDARASNRSDAYYWRAWNRRHLTQIDAGASGHRSGTGAALQRARPHAGRHDRTRPAGLRRGAPRPRHGLGNSTPENATRRGTSGSSRSRVESWPPGAKAFAGGGAVLRRAGQGDRDVSRGNGCPQGRQRGIPHEADWQALMRRSRTTT